MQQWNQIRFAENQITSFEGTHQLTWQQEQPGATFTHSVTLSTNAGLPQYDQTIMLRTLGHILLSGVPNEGLMEALEGLAETFTFWTDSAQEFSESSKPTSTFYAAAKGASYQRPIFRVAEE